jgi:hypothetical protein
MTVQKKRMIIILISCFNELLFYFFGIFFHRLENHFIGYRFFIFFPAVIIRALSVMATARRRSRELLAQCAAKGLRLGMFFRTYYAVLEIA